MKTKVILSVATVALAAAVQAEYYYTAGFGGMNVTIPELGVGYATNLSFVLPTDGKSILDLNVRFDLGNAVGDAVWNGDMYVQLSHVDTYGNSAIAGEIDSDESTMPVSAAAATYDRARETDERRTCSQTMPSPPAVAPRARPAEE